MASMVHFFRISPDEYWGMDVRDLEALSRFREKWIQAQKTK
jgi:hypothetical protein